MQVTQMFFDLDPENFGLVSGDGSVDSRISIGSTSPEPERIEDLPYEQLRSSYFRCSNCGAGVVEVDCVYCGTPGVDTRPVYGPARVTDWTPDTLLPYWETRMGEMGREYRQICPVCLAAGVENCLCPLPEDYCPENIGITVDIYGFRTDPRPLEISTTQYWGELSDLPGELQDLSRLDDWHDDSAVLLDSIDVAFGSDYIGSTVERSNFECLVEKYWGEGPGKLAYVYTYYEHPGGHFFLVDMARLLRDRGDLAGELREDLRGLAQYPVLDESHLSELERENEDSAWEDWTRRDAERELAKLFPALEEIWESRELLRSDFEMWADMAGTYWEDETGGSAYIDVDRVCREVTPEMLDSAGYLPIADYVASRLQSERSL